MAMPVLKKRQAKRSPVFLDAENFVQTLTSVVRFFVSLADFTYLKKVPEGTTGFRLTYGSWKLYAKEELALDKAEVALRDLPLNTIIEVTDGKTLVKISETTRLNGHTTLRKYAVVALNYAERSAKITVYVDLKVKDS